jgi:RNA polymerase sigma factor (sigma-70 family)
MQQTGAAVAGFDRIIREHGDAIARAASGYARTPSDRDDLIQEILFALWRALPGFRGDSSERTFVLRIAHNRGITFSLSRRSSTTLPDPEELADDAPAIDDRMIQSERRERLFEAIRSLPELQRQAVMLYLDGLPQREIAQLQGTTETNIGVRLTRARQTLRSLLREDDT